MPLDAFFMQKWAYLSSALGRTTFSWFRSEPRLMPEAPDAAPQLRLVYAKGYSYLTNDPSGQR